MKSVIIQGIKGSFHHEAVTRFFKQEQVEIVDSPTFNSLVRQVVDKKVDLGMMAIENSIAGSILPNYSLMTKNKLYIGGEIALPIKHNLLVLKGQKLEDITEVRTHPMALLQCENFLDKHESWQRLAMDDTATCARNIQEKQMYGVASIGSKLAAQMYDLEILAQDIHDVYDNYTRFYLVGTQPMLVKDFNKATLFFYTDHKQGRLSKVLEILANHELNLTKIQSVPLSGTVFQYSFHVNVVLTNNNYDLYYKALEKLKEVTQYLNVLGEYMEDKRPTYKDMNQ
ncbi:prephenate dehydratase [Myroides albus]|uniref:prephenate dehydratase n=1 Tax=Myroides albus TaxID=2562892 RepID=A0A6I3LR27_9FLAO|nr:prephenate dehydratase [Myroides albus]MTG98632.1 prephenate dehydratase [Myroides albus]UVD79195.1 prephenate dehydratase [Myroides albus]